MFAVFGVGGVDCDGDVYNGDVYTTLTAARPRAHIPPEPGAHVDMASTRGRGRGEGRRWYSTSRAVHSSTFQRADHARVKRSS